MANPTSTNSRVADAVVGFPRRTESWRVEEGKEAWCAGAWEMGCGGTVGRTGQAGQDRFSLAPFFSFSLSFPPPPQSSPLPFPPLVFFFPRRFTHDSQAARFLTNPRPQPRTIDIVIYTAISDTSSASRTASPASLACKCTRRPVLPLPDTHDRASARSGRDHNTPARPPQRVSFAQQMVLEVL
ncbi:hypothetical protein Landi51_07731 [Colletotrichum acutatum]